MALLQLTDERPDEEIRQLVLATIADAEAEWAPLKYEGEYPENGIGITIMRPRHVGLATDKWQMTVTTAWADWINKTLGDNNYEIITGLFNLTIDPATTELYPSANGKDMPRFNIEQLYALDLARAWFTKPFAVKANNNLTIQAIGRVMQTERLGLMGYTLAKRSYLLTAAP